jgi:hypothetical protein
MSTILSPTSIERCVERSLSCSELHCGVKRAVCRWRRREFSPHEDRDLRLIQAREVTGEEPWRHLRHGLLVSGLVELRLPRCLLHGARHHHHRRLVSRGERGDLSSLTVIKPLPGGRTKQALDSIVMHGNALISMAATRLNITYFIIIVNIELPHFQT